MYVEYILEIQNQIKSRFKFLPDENFMADIKRNIFDILFSTFL